MDTSKIIFTPKNTIPSIPTEEKDITPLQSSFLTGLSNDARITLDKRNEDNFKAGLGLLKDQIQMNNDLNEQRFGLIQQHLQDINNFNTAQGLVGLASIAASKGNNSIPQGYDFPVTQSAKTPATTTTKGYTPMLPDRSVDLSTYVKDYISTPYVWGGGHGGKSKGLDCSGFVGSLLHKSGVQGYAGLTAAEQIRKAEKNGISIQISDLGNLQGQETALIGLTDPKGKEKPGRYKGISHIGVAYRDPNTGQIVVADSSVSKGVHTTSLDRYINYYNGKEGRIPHIIKLQ